MTKVKYDYPSAKEIICKTCELKNKALREDTRIADNVNLFKLLAETVSATGGWIKTTEAMEIPHTGCLVQVTTKQRNPDGSWAISEAVTFVPGVVLLENAAGRCLIKAP